ncbi:MAG: lysophospholipase [Deltaproteobacteria bacterium]|uniref:alpha/beta hydrolase n=1 Tax=Candidatus Deferrimicrobium sp. TaxID=3060586 RepID=UPI00272B597B|nr:alpha/beta fold hydrolase [Candidatus Deferrimicrobium sp.]MCR4310183.1 lysophospholipase [Deltaproteobacteria bacterium]
MPVSDTGSFSPRLQVLLCHAILALALSASGCGSPFFHPTREHAPVPGLDNVVRQDVRFASEDGVPLHGWLLTPRDRVSRGTILFLHGNAENISTHVQSVLWLVQEGYTVFAFDYRGYGGSGGEAPDIPGVHRDARAALSKILSLPGVSPDRLVVFGQSLGAAIAVHTVATASSTRRPRALILDSPFAGYRRIVRDKLSSMIITWPLAWPVSRFFNDDYSPERWIGKIAPVPVIVIHGTADRVVPYAHGKMLYDLASDPKGIWTVEGGGHATALRNPEVRGQFLAFLASVLPAVSEGEKSR